MQTFRQYIEEKSIGFDLAIPVRRALESVKDKIIHKDLGNLEIAEKLNKALSQFHVIFKESWGGESADPDLAQVRLTGGAIVNNGQVEIEYESSFYEIFEDEYEWKNFVNAAVKLIGHEIIHRYQFKQIKNKNRSDYHFQQVLRKLEVDPSNTSKYLGAKSEMMAFAHQAVVELLQLGYEQADIINLIRRPYDRNSIIGRNESHTFWMYTDYFEEGDPILKKFLKYMYSYVTVAKE